MGVGHGGQPWRRDVFSDLRASARPARVLGVVSGQVSPLLTRFNSLLSRSYRSKLSLFTFTYLKPIGR